MGEKDTKQGVLDEWMASLLGFNDEREGLLNRLERALNRFDYPPPEETKEGKLPPEKTETICQRFNDLYRNINDQNRRLEQLTNRVEGLI